MHVEMDKVKRYIDVYVPVTGCSLRCPYCYITIHRKFDSKIKDFRYTPEEVRTALSRKRLGGTCLINLCAGGETLLTPMTVEYAKALLEEGHYVMIVTNGTVSLSFDLLSELPPLLLNHLFFRFSYHYLQLKERGLLDSFFNNIKAMRDAGASFTLEVTPYDELIPYIDEMNDLAVEQLGALPHFTIARDENNMKDMPKLTKMNDDDYRATWGRFGSPLFDFKMSIFQKQRREFCYAGDWVFYVSLEDGMMYTCHETQHPGVDIFTDPSKPIPFCPVGNNCKACHCWNGHSWIALGAIPELNTPTYADLRNRCCPDGTEWLKPEMKYMMNSRLNESNQDLSAWGKFGVNAAAGRHWHSNLRLSAAMLLGDLRHKELTYLPAKNE